MLDQTFPIVNDDDSSGTTGSLNTSAFSGSLAEVSRQSSKNSMGRRLQEDTDFGALSFDILVDAQVCPDSLFSEATDLPDFIPFEDDDDECGFPSRGSEFSTVGQDEHRSLSPSTVPTYPSMTPSINMTGNMTDWIVRSRSISSFLPELDLGTSTCLCETGNGNPASAHRSPTKLEFLLGLNDAILDLQNQGLLLDLGLVSALGNEAPFDCSAFRGSASFDLAETESLSETETPQPNTTATSSPTTFRTTTFSVTLTPPPSSSSPSTVPPVNLPGVAPGRYVQNFPLCSISASINTATPDQFLSLELISPAPGGSDGSPGSPGSGGSDGSPGSPGTAGSNGRPGSPGTAGSNGRPGSPGSDGSDGRPGSPGSDGSNGRPGSPGSDGSNGR